MHADLSDLPQFEVVRVCVNNQCRDTAASGAGFQGPVGAIPGTSPVRAEFIEGNGNIAVILVGSGVMKTDCGCSNIVFEADFERGILRQTN
jgi:hypothetical protein